MGGALFFLPQNESGVILYPMTGLKNHGFFFTDHYIITVSQSMGLAQRRVDSPGGSDVGHK